MREASNTAEYVVVFKALADFSELTRESAKALAELEALKKAAESMGNSEAKAAERATAARKLDVTSLREKSEAMKTVGQNADAYNRQVNWQGATSESQAQANLARRIDYQRLLNIQQQRGFASPQQSYAWRQQELAQQILWNKAIQQGYTTPDQYLGYLSALRQAMALENVQWNQRTALLNQATDAQLGQVNALAGTHVTAQQLVGGVTDAQAALSSLASQQTTPTVFLSDAQLRGAVALDTAILNTLDGKKVTATADLDSSGFMTGLAAIKKGLAVAAAQFAALRARFADGLPVAGDTAQIAMTGGTNAGAGPPPGITTAAAAARDPGQAALTSAVQEMTRIFRVEHSETGIGPHQGNVMYRLFAESAPRSLRQIASTPAPDEDPVLGRNFSVEAIARMFSEGGKSAFSNMEQLNTWFAGFLPQLKELGYVVRAFDVPVRDVIKGATQVIYKPENARLAEPPKFDPSELAAIWLRIADLSASRVAAPAVPASRTTPSDIKALQADRAAASMDRAAAAAANLRRQLLAAGLSADQADAQMDKLGMAAGRVAEKINAIADSAVTAQAELYQLGTAQAEPVIKLNDDDFLSRITRDMAMLAAVREHLAITAAPDAISARFTVSESMRIFAPPRLPAGSVTAGQPPLAITARQPLAITQGTQPRFATSDSGTTAQARDAAALADALAKDAAAFDNEAKAAHDASRKVMADAADEAKAYENAAFVEAAAAKRAADARAEESSRAAGEAIASVEAAREVYRAASQNEADALSAPLTAESAQAVLTAARIKSLADAQLTEAQRVADELIVEAERAADAQVTAAARAKAAWDAVYASEAGNRARQKVLDDAAAADQASRDESAARQQKFIDDEAIARAAKVAAARDLADQAAARASYDRARADAAAMLAELGNGAAAERAAVQLENMAHATDDASQSSHFMWASQVAAKIATSQLSDAAKKSAADFITLAAAETTGADASHRAYDAQVALARATRDAGGAAAVAAAAAGKGGGGGAIAAWAAVNAGGGGNFFGIPNPRIPLFAGAIASPAFLHSMSVFSLALHLLLDFILTAVPAAITLLVGLGAFAAGAYPTVQAIVGQMQNINTVGEALGKTIPPMTGALQQMQDAVKPSVMVLFGEGLMAINNQAGQSTLLDWALKTGSYLDKLGARFVVFTRNNSGAFKSLLEEGGHYLALFGSIGDSIIHVFTILAKGGQITHVAEGVLVAFAGAFSLLSKVFNIIGPIGSAAVIAFFALIHYGGLLTTMAATAVEWLVTLASKIPGVSGLAANLAQRLGLSNDALVNLGRNTAKMDAVANSLLRGEANAAAMGSALVGSDANLVKVVSRQPEIANVAAAFKLSAEQVAANTIAFGKLPGGIDAAARASGNLSQDIIVTTGKMGELEKAAALVGVASVNSSGEAARGIGRYSTAIDDAASNAAGKTGAMSKLWGGVASAGGAAAGFVKANWALAVVAVAAGIGFLVYKMLQVKNVTQDYLDSIQSGISKSSLTDVFGVIQNAASQTADKIKATQKSLVTDTAQANAEMAALARQAAQVNPFNTRPGSGAQGNLYNTRPGSGAQGNFPNNARQGGQSVYGAVANVNFSRDQALLAGYQADWRAFNHQLFTYNTNVTAIANSTGTSISGAKALIVQAGITTNQMLDDNKQHLAATVVQVQAVVAAYKAMDLGVGRTAASLNALNFAQGADANQLGTIDAQMTKIVAAQDQLQAVLLGSEQGFVNVTGALHTLGTDAKVSGANLSGLNDASLKLSGDFYGTVLPAMQKQNDALQMQNISTANLTTVIASQVAYALPYAKGNLAARDSLVSFINQGLGPSTVNLKTLDGWVSKNQTNLGGWKKIVDQTTIAASGFAGILTTALNAQLTQSVIQFTGVGLAQQQYAKDLLAGTQATAAGKSDRWHLITDLMNAGMNAKDAANFVDGLTRKLGKVPAKTTTDVQVNTAAGAAAVKKIHDELTSPSPASITPKVNINPALATLHQLNDQRLNPKTVTPTVNAAPADQALRNLRQGLVHLHDPVPPAVPGVDTKAADQALSNLRHGLVHLHDPQPAAKPKVDTSAAEQALKTLQAGLASLHAGNDNRGPSGPGTPYKAPAPAPVKISVVFTPALSTLSGELKGALTPPSATPWGKYFTGIGKDFTGSVGSNVAGFFKSTLPGLFSKDTADWDKLWTGSQKSFTSQVEDALRKFFGPTVAGWLASFTAQWSATFTKAWDAVQTIVVNAMQKFFGPTMTGWLSGFSGQWKNTWTSAWSNVDSSIVNNFTALFQTHFPSWLTTLGHNWGTMWKNGFAAFQQTVENPISAWFGTALPNAMTQGMRAGLNAAIGDINKVVGFINNDILKNLPGGLKVQPVSKLAAGGMASSHMAQAGSVPGAGEHDSVAAMLMPGEFVLRKPARAALEQAYGAGFMGHLNQADSWLGSGSRGTMASQGWGGPGHAGGGYVNPIPPGAHPGRVDQGVDFTGAGPIRALGPAQIAGVGGGGWPGGPYMNYQLQGGSAAGSWVYVAENINPVVTPGQSVTAGQVIAQMFNGGTGIEMGWASPNGGNTPLSQTPAAGGISGANLPAGGTLVGRNFEALLVSLGAPGATNMGQAPGGKLPPGMSAGSGGGGGIAAVIQTLGQIEGLLNSSGGLSASGKSLAGIYPGGASALLKAANNGVKAIWAALWKSRVAGKLPPSLGASIPGAVALKGMSLLNQGVSAFYGAQDAKAKSQVTTGGGGSVPISGNVSALQKYAASLFPAHGWTVANELGALIKLWNRESGWNPNAQNPTSTAYGIAQFLDTTWGVYGGSGKTSDPSLQIQDGLDYIQGKYGDPNAAWATELRIGSYASGGGVDDMEGMAAGGNILAFGASTTAGVGATAGHDYVSDLERLAGSKYHFLNAGISGNRLVTKGGTGAEGVDRFGNLLKGINEAIVWEGINDIAAGTEEPAIAAGYRDIISTAHKHGVKVVGGTLQPGGFPSAKEKQRESVNQWIRGSGRFDAVADFDKALRDPKHPDRMGAWVYNQGQAHGIHPGNPGYAAAARVADAAITGSLTKPRPPVRKPPAHKPPSKAKPVPGPAPWQHVIDTVRGTQATEHTWWARFLARVGKSKLTAAETQTLHQMEAEQLQEERLVSQAVTDATRWNAHLGEVSEAPGPMDALFKKLEQYIVSYDKKLLAQPSVHQTASAEWGHVQDVARNTQKTEHARWGAFLNAVRHKKLTAAEKSSLNAMDTTQGAEERLFAQTLADAGKWNAKKGQVAEPPKTMNALFRQIDSNVAAYDKRLLAQPFTWAGTGAKRHKVPAGWRALGALSPDAYAGLEQGVAGLKVPLGSLSATWNRLTTPAAGHSPANWRNLADLAVDDYAELETAVKGMTVPVESMASMWNQLRYPATPGPLRLPTQKFKDPLPQLPGQKGLPPATFAAGGSIGMGGLLSQLSMVPGMASGGWAGMDMPDMPAVKPLIAPSVRSQAAQHTSGPGAGGNTVTFGDINIHNPVAQAAPVSLTHATQKAAWLAGREL